MIKKDHQIMAIKINNKIMIKKDHQIMAIKINNHITF